MATEFRVLGPLEVSHDGRRVPLPAGKARVLLAALLLRANQVVPVDELVERLWDEPQGDPARLKATLHMAVTRLRQSLDEANVVRTAPGGYVADVRPDALDLHRFRALAGERRFAEALELWRGEPLSDVRSDVLHREEVAPLLEERLTVVEQRIDADLAAGRAPELVAQLRSLTRRHPLRERFWGQLVLALYRSDQQAEALAAYRSVSGLLAEELGVDPGPRLQELHQRILAGNLDSATPVPVPVPRQIPGHMPLFVGRADELRRLEEGIDEGAVVISAIGGAAGMGKTALAVRWAHQVAARFPDGQLYVDLRGFGPTGAPVEPDEAIRGFLDALGVAPERVPSTAEARVGLYRSVLADRKVLVLLDNARDSDQVRPLLPGKPGCLAVVTSRDALTGLVAQEGARPLTLGVLDDAEAEELLRRRLGAERVAAEPEAVEELIAHCAGLPLALSVVGARAAVHPGFPLRVFAGELADERTRLEALDTGEPSTSVRAVFSWSYDRLSPAAARMFGLLGAHPGPEVSVHAAASTAAVPVGVARSVLGELSRAHLLVEHASGRFSFHDLLHAYARDVAAEMDQDEVRLAVQRLLDHYLHTARAGHRVIYPQRDLPLGEPVPDVVVTALGDRAKALAWFALERSALFAMIGHAADLGFLGHAWQIPQSITVFCRARGYWLEATRDASTAGLGLPDQTDVTSADRASLITLDLDRAGFHLRRALPLVEDRRGRAAIHRNLAALDESTGRNREALRHLTRALDELEPLGVSLDYAVASNSVGWLHTLLGEPRLALGHCERALALVRELGDVFGEAATLDSLGLIHHHLGNLDEAVHHYRSALPLYRAVGERYEEAATLDRLGDTHQAANDLREAHQAWTRAVAVLDDLGNPDAARVRAKLRRNEAPAEHVGGRPGLLPDQ
ncbi:AfsR/SARP family transcriptional regulator [Saccharothrix deserti]|uniref:AfsR/SARP family transcriptional regulator n=1 Tax=Saccharothrix deserti TaxID=2593674 RepID=UPI00131A63D3|nr:AfsR/SARP family transcriptional regulator [Saccharothrix deserti]